MTEHQVLIVGGGPTGLMLAGELALAGVDVAIVERRTNQELVGSRAGGLLARTIEVLDQRGIADRFLAEGTTAQLGTFGGISLDISALPTRHGYILGLWQRHIERILGGWVAELGAPVLRDREVTGFTQDDGGVAAEISDGTSIRASYLVGCDGGRSVIRKTAGIEFPGWDATTSALIAQVELTEEPVWGIHHDEIGRHAFSKQEGGPIGVLVTERRAGRSDEPTLADLSAALIDAFGTDYGVHDPTSISRFTDMTRQAATYRRGRILLAGDAAHVHSPDGGQGLNLGVQDAVNLGWKLAQVVKGDSPDVLLDTYHAERHPVGARALRNTMALVALRRPDERIKALGDVMSELVSADDAARGRLAAMMAGLDVQYDLGQGHPLLGRRMPDLDLETIEGSTRVFDLLHAARPVLINLGEAGAIDLSPWAGRVRSVDALATGPWDLPAIGAVTAPTAVLVRPDGYVAWVGEGSETSLAEALSRWFGPARMNGSRRAGVL